MNLFELIFRITYYRNPDPKELKGSKIQIRYNKRKPFIFEKG